MLASYGRFIHRRRRTVLLLSALLLAASVATVLQGGDLLAYQTPADTESGRALDLVEAQVPAATEATFALVLSHPTLRWDEKAFRDEVARVVAPLERDARVNDVRTPYGETVQVAATMVSRDAHRVLVVVSLKDDLATARDYYPELRAKVASPLLDVKATDRIAVFSDIETILAEDLVRAEAVSLPLSLLLLLVVFGTVVAALLPVGVGVLSVVGGMALVFLLSRATDMAVYAVNIVSLIGLGVAIDYSLFMVSRFREELAPDPRDVEGAIARTVATAGRATAFSGLTVAIGLLGLSFYEGLFFRSMGVAGALVVGLAVLYALTFLPALIAVLGPRVNKWPVPFAARRSEGRAWSRLARAVMRRPMRVLLPTLAILLVAGLPFLALQMGSAGVSQLPPHAESRVGQDLLRAEFPGQGLNPVTVVVAWPSGSPLARDRVGALHDLSRDLAKLPGVERVQGIVDLDPRMTKAQYQDAYARPRSQLPPAMADVVDATVGSTLVVLRVMVEGEDTSQQARDVVAAIRAHAPPPGARLLVTGPTAIDVDTIALIHAHTPAAVAFIVVTTYALLLLQTGSVLLPLKALVMNVLSIAASFGALVWVFQWGNLSGLLGFTPAPIDPSTPVLLFCIVFGLSMDYEVLLLSRMHEEYERTGDNALAVENGLAKSGRLITSAAAIMVLVFGSFALAQVTIVKALGVGLALAVAVDATIVRALVVPAAMRLMGRWNWWAPAWITRAWKALG